MIAFRKHVLPGCEAPLSWRSSSLPSLLTSSIALSASSGGMPKKDTKPFELGAVEGVRWRNISSRRSRSALKEEEEVLRLEPLTASDLGGMVSEFGKCQSVR